MRDWEALRKRLDRGGMFERIHELPEQMHEAVVRFGSGPDVPAPAKADRILLLGMGGSAIGGEIVAALAAREASVPVAVVRGDAVPAWCGPSTLAVATSHSGNTEETIAASRAALATGAAFVAITSGGRLARLAGEAGAPVLVVPSGAPPRTAIGHLTVSALLFLGRAGVALPGDEAIDEAGRRLASLRGEWGLAEGPSGGALPARLAEKIGLSIPWIYHGGGEMAPVATRWRTQFAENGKRLAHSAVFPEACHNEIVGWGMNRERHARIAIVALRSEAYGPYAAEGMEAALSMLEARGASIVPVELPAGGGALARIFAGVFLGDFVSYFLALAAGVDPTPIEAIDELKRTIGGAPTGVPGPGRTREERR